MRLPDAKINNARCVAALLGTLLLAAAPSQALAHGGHSHAARSKAKKKPAVLVRCASVSVRCHTHGGTQGPVGPQGPAGATGAAGPAGEGVAARIRSTGAVESATTEKPIPISPPVFSQGPGQVLELLGEATVTFPSGSCNTESTTKGAHEGELEGTVTLDGVDVGLIEAESDEYVPGAVITVPVLWFGGFGPEIASGNYTPPLTTFNVTHSLSIAASDDCNTAGATHFTVDGVAIDVLQSG